MSLFLLVFIIRHDSVLSLALSLSLSLSFSLLVWGFTENKFLGVFISGVFQYPTLLISTFVVILSSRFLQVFCFAHLLLLELKTLHLFSFFFV